MIQIRELHDCSLDSFVAILKWQLLIPQLNLTNITTNHTFSKDKINLLDPGRKGFRPNLLEHLEIRRGLKTGKFVTNDQTIFDSSILVNPLPFIIITLNKHIITFA